MTKTKLMTTTLLSCISAILIPIFMMLNAVNFFTPAQHTLEKRQPSIWPPQLNKPYPDLELIDQDGMKFKLSDLKGHVIIIEPTGMNCPACQAFSGAHEYGAYQNNAVEQHSKSFRKIFPQYAKGLKLPSKDIFFVQLLLYDMKMGPPRPEDAANWAKHFNIRKKDYHIVAVSPYDLRSQASYNLVPGFQLIDRDFNLRADSSGHHPKHNLYTQLIPLTPKLVSQKTRY